MFFVWVVDIDLVFVCGRKLLGFGENIELDFVFLWVVEIDFISMMEIDLDLISV